MPSRKQWAESLHNWRLSGYTKPDEHLADAIKAGNLDWVTLYAEGAAIQHVDPRSGRGWDEVYDTSNMSWMRHGTNYRLKPMPPPVAPPPVAPSSETPWMYHVQHFQATKTLSPRLLEAFDAHNLHLVFEWCRGAAVTVGGATFTIDSGVTSELAFDQPTHEYVLGKVNAATPAAPPPPPIWGDWQEHLDYERTYGIMSSRLRGAVKAGNRHLVEAWVRGDTIRHNGTLHKRDLNEPYNTFAFTESTKRYAIIASTVLTEVPPTQEETTMLPNIPHNPNQPRVVTGTYYMGQDITGLTPLQLIAAVQNLENEIASLKGIKSKSTGIDKRKAELANDLKVVLAELDSRE